MQIRAVPCQGGVRLVLQGELDLASAPDLEAAARAIECPAGHLVLDLRALTFVDSCGLRAILAARSASAARGKRMAVVEGPVEVQHVFTLTGMDRLVDVVRHPAQATTLLADPSQEDAPSHSLARWSSLRSDAPASVALPS